MKRILLLIFLTSNYFGNAQNLVSNGNMEVFSFPNSSPDDWSSASDFGGFSQNTTDFTEGLSSVEFRAEFSDLSMFTRVDIPLEAGKTYTIRYDYKYLGNNFDSNTNIEFSFFSVSPSFSLAADIQDNNWNTATAQFTPTVTKLDSEATIKVIPANGPDFDYKVLIDNVQVFVNTGLSNTEFNLEKNISIVSSINKQFKIKKTSDITITNVTAYSILGKEQQIVNESKDYSHFNLNSLSSGIYILQIATNKGRMAKKVFVK